MHVTTLFHWYGGVRRYILGVLDDRHNAPTTPGPRLLRDVFPVFPLHSDHENLALASDYLSGCRDAMRSLWRAT
jgi:hypothetical protein